MYAIFFYFVHKKIAILSDQKTRLFKEQIINTYDTLCAKVMAIKLKSSVTKNVDADFKIS